MAMAEKKIFPREQGNCSCKTPISEMGQPIVLCSSAVWTKPARKKGEKNRTWSIAKPIFLEQSVHFAKSREVKWNIPLFGVQTPHGQSQRKERCKTPPG